MTGHPWIVTALWGGLILALTSIPGSDVPTFELPAADKLGHAALYAVLGLLIMRAMRAQARRVWPAVVALAGVAVFGAVDEWHQRLVPGRSTELADWLADMVGGAIGIACAATFKGRARP